MKVKSNGESFEEADSQANRCWMVTKVPSESAALLADLPMSPEALAQHRFSLHTLPLASTLPAKSDTANYIHLQHLYKTHTEEEKQAFVSYLCAPPPVDNAVVDAFVKNARALQVLRGEHLAAFDYDRAALGLSPTDSHGTGPHPAVTLHRWYRQALLVFGPIEWDDPGRARCAWG
ncbi:hypothetical protein L210DRAFT_3653150 [Boletus edulis BED1]|uniref:Uncharacterized protein n=1 Tax=Boletus edulis BED1 TaxID=1328754 RepID=A0AAD4BFB6_BOLED|nr:hypothetical protein L210DRAFT_3653150 [Boletus edulis BED1]